ncbi:penicillin-binding transpeptidase domain-containing protein [Campylobacter upsaliensis]|uniref:penicillin-binding transpeptidase domain-containing protein n=1 Tax=Campylobacter upsaliensis TaxID=28080 RepID=UPI0012D095B7|nr:penicillin-binding transpeptidase domain-containing protein [Campylobacter upsaliensis]EAL3918832.1 class D beta-lactamase [Campylobacter upsaliensis]MCR2087364.1 penicillin-binding transpeptidase domain-containing protein [Campylobacter upsaliensis]
MKNFLTFFIIFTFFTNLKADILPNFFKDYETKGVFVLYDGKSFLANDKKRAEKRFSPASTFKIFNALFALNLGIIQDEKEIFYFYNNEKVFLPSWKNDANLSSALKRSQVPAFKFLARKIGKENMQKNSQIDSFWLDNSLKINAKEQAILLYKLATTSLPYSLKSQKILKNLLFYKEINGVKIYAKTGFNNEAQIASIVGFYELNQQAFSFGLNLDIKDYKSLAKRDEILEKYLKFLIKTDRV